MKKIYFFLLLAGLIAVAAVVTNPDEEQHREAVRAKVYAHIQKSLPQESPESNSVWEELSRAMVESLGNEFIDVMINSLVTADNYVLFSRTRVTLFGESEVIGFGVLGHVFLSSNLDESLEDGFLPNETGR